MLTHAVACRQNPRHRFPHSSARVLAQKSKEIYADACGCIPPGKTMLMNGNLLRVGVAKPDRLLPRRKI